MKRWLGDAGLQLAVSAASVAVALAAGAVFILALGKNPFTVYGILVSGSIGDNYGLGQVVYKATTLAFVGVAVALSFRAGLFNIGAEGQLYLGGFMAAWVGLQFDPEKPYAGMWWVCCLAAFGGGAAAAAVPAVLKATRGTHEVIVTIMMNFIVIGAVHYFASSRYDDVIMEPGTTHTWELPQEAWLKSYKETFKGSTANSSFWIAVAVAVAATYLLWRTRTGFEMRASGLNAKAAEAGGVRMRWTMCLTLLVSGGIAGLGAINFVLGNKGYFEKEFSAGAGFLGIAVALLARSHPVAVIPAAFLFATLSEGAVAIGQSKEQVPGEIIDILQAIVILFLLVGARLLDRAIAAWQKSRQKAVRP